jgi:hypothetical protein
MKGNFHVRFGGGERAVRLRTAAPSLPNGIAPLSVECDRIHVITDPAQALDQIAADTVAALRTRVRARSTTPST